MVSKNLVSDVVVFTALLYVDNVSRLTKNSMERTLPMMYPHLGIYNNCETHHVKRYEEYAVVISNCGLLEQSHYQVKGYLLIKIAVNLQSETIAEVYRWGGGASKNKTYLFKSAVYRCKCKKLLRKTGNEVVAVCRIMDETISYISTYESLNPSKELYF